MDKTSARRFAFGFFIGSAAAFLVTVLAPQWLGLAIGIGLILLVGGLGSYLVYLVHELAEAVGFEEADHRPT